MQTHQLNEALSQNVYTKRAFLGVFPSDQLPDKEMIKKYPACFIANVDPHSEPGSHWLAFYMYSAHHIEFFDSFGHDIAHFPGHISNFVRSFDQVDFNSTRLQSTATAVCGQYCIYYLYYKCNGYSLNKILLPFVSQDLCNDIKVYGFVRKVFQVRAPFK